MDQQIIEAAKQSDLLALVGHDVLLKRVAGTNGGEWAGPCPFCGGRDRMRVQPERGLWWCRQCGGEHWHSAIDYVMKRDNIDFQNAVAVLTSGAALSASFKPAQPKQAEAQQTASDGDKWQERARALMTWATAQLWEPGGQAALDYLHARGLSDETIKGAGLGYNAQDRFDRDVMRWGLADGRKAIYIPAGILIPGEMCGKLHYIKARRLDKKTDKAGRSVRYEAVTGSGRALYLGDKMRGLPDVFVTEGEFDALLLRQIVGDLADVVTLGSASNKMRDELLPYLVAGEAFYICTDDDDDGEAIARHWLSLVGDRGERIRPPQGKDVTEAWQAGVNLREWAEYIMCADMPQTTIEAAALAALESCEAAYTVGDLAGAARWADDFERRACDLWATVEG